MTPDRFADPGLQTPRITAKRFRAYKRYQAGISRRMLYPLTAFYGGYTVLMLGVVAWHTSHPYLAIAFYLTGVPVWTFFEYLAHRWLLHGRYKPGKSLHRRLLVKYVNPVHWEHHERPFDGEHINGELKDLLPLFALMAPLSFLFPVWSGPMLLAGVVQCYVIEEWVHHSVHYYKFRDPYFKYMKKHHFYHHTSPGSKRGYGLTSGFWDIPFGTRFPDHVRRRLYGGRKRSGAGGSQTPAEGLDINAPTFES